MRGLLTKAQANLGGKFNIRDFHAFVLSLGALPVDILERHLAHWQAEASEGVRSLRSLLQLSI
ncbi:MAG: DUF885 family protein [Caulobacterales bacterium]|nr:DUF885 family protein [Caulobacterales bacterium]